MMRKDELKTEGFWPSENVGIDINLKGPTNDKSVKAGLYSPGIAYRFDDKYFSFGVTAPEGAVIPYEMIGNSPFTNAITIIIDPRAQEIAVGDTVRAIWTVLSAEDFYEFQSDPVPIESKNAAVLITLPDTEAVKFVGKKSEVGYIHMPEAGGANVSPKKPVYVAPSMGPKPVLKIPAVEKGVLNTKDHPNGIKVIIEPITNMHRYNALKIFWVDESNIRIDAQRHMTVNPNKAMEFVIPAVVYQSHVGKRVLVQYFISLGANMSPNLRWSAGNSKYVEFDVIGPLKTVNSL